MFEKIEFSDLNKFITSIGLILVASAFIIPWFYLGRDPGLEITVDEYAKLTHLSQHLLQKRACLNMKILDLLPCITIALLLLGLFLISFGIFKWKREEDRKKNIEALNPNEAKEKIEMEANEELNSNESNPKAKESGPIDKTKLVANLTKLEDIFFQKIEAFNSFTHETIRNGKILPGLTIDFFLQAFNSKKHPDILIEIKFIQTKLSSHIVHESLTRLVEGFKHLYPSHRGATVYLFIVYKDEIAAEEEIDRFKDTCKSIRRQLSNLPLGMMVMSESEAKEFDISRILR